MNAVQELEKLRVVYTLSNVDWSCFDPVWGSSQEFAWRNEETHEGTQKFILSARNWNRVFLNTKKDVYSLHGALDSEHWHRIDQLVLVAGDKISTVINGDMDHLSL